MIEYSENHAEEAVKLYLRAIRANSQFLGAHVGLGQAYLDQQRYQEAATEFRRAIQLAPDTHPLLPELHCGLAVACRSLNLADGAIEELQIAIRLRPDYEPARQRLLEMQQTLRNGSAPATTSSSRGNR